MNATEHLKAVIVGGAWIGHDSKGEFCQSCRHYLPSIPVMWGELNADELKDPHGKFDNGDDYEISNAIKFLQGQGEL